MLNLAEYRKKPLSLADYLPWACLVAPGVILNKDGSFLRAARYRGPDLDSATDAELVSITARLNNVLKRFGSRWPYSSRPSACPSQSYPGGCFADPLSWLVDEERKAAFEAELSHFESRYYVSFLYLPPADATAKTEGLLYEREGGKTLIRDPRAYLDGFLSETDRALALLANILPELTPLRDAELLSYLHNTISEKRMSVAVPDMPAYLDAILCDSSLTGGVSPRLGSQHLRMLTVLGFPNATSPGMLARCFERSGLFLSLGDAFHPARQETFMPHALGTASLTPMGPVEPFSEADRICHPYSIENPGSVS